MDLPVAAVELGDSRVIAEATDGLYLRIRSSKTDQEGAGATVALPFGQHPGTCPPRALLRWVGLLAAHQHGRPALMRAVFATPLWVEWAHLC